MAHQTGNRPAVLVVAAVIIEGARVLVSQRPQQSHFGGYWELPGGKIEPGESPEEALSRELREELGLEIEVGRIEEVIFDRNDQTDVLLLFYRCTRTEGSSPRPLQVQRFKWATSEELSRLSFPPADNKFMQRLMQLLTP